ncbi:MAG: PASTA domain-containing protein [Terriglobales bacterium]
MRGFFRFVVLALILLIVAMASALTAMRVAIHGREVTVPKLVGLSTTQAQRLALQNGLLVDVENRFYSTTFAEGQVMSQSPAPGEKVRRGWRVRLAESLGAQHVVIPDVVGQSTRAAEINLRRRGLEPGTMAFVHMPDSPEDQVIAQSPPAAAVDVASPSVSLLFAAPPDPQALVMPSFVGRQLSEVTRSIQDAGLKVGNVRVVVANGNGTAMATPTIVSKQSPTVGQKVTPGMTVDLEVSK